MSDRNNMIDLIHLHGVLKIQTYVIYSIGWWWVYIKWGWSNIWNHKRNNHFRCGDMTSTNIKEEKAQVRNNEQIISGLELGINVCFDFVVENWSKYLCICLRPKQWYLELCLVGRIWSGVLKINLSSMKRFQGSCINSIMILNHGSLKVCLHHLGWRLFMEFKKSAPPKVDQNPEVKSEKKLSLALFIVRWTFHNFLLENSLLKIAHSIID